MPLPPLRRPRDTRTNAKSRVAAPDAADAPAARNVTLDRFKRARTSSADTDSSSIEADPSERPAFATDLPPDPARPGGLSDDGTPYPADDERSDEMVDKLIGDSSLQLGDAQAAAPQGGGAAPASADTPEALLERVNAWRQEQPRAGHIWYVLPTSWLSAWRDAVRAGSSDVPPIDTASLCTEAALPGAAARLKPGLLEGTDYDLVPEPAWAALSSRYPVSGAALPRAVVPGFTEGAPPRIELYPPRIELVRLVASAPPPQTASPLAPESSLLSIITLSAAESIQELKARARAVRAIAPTIADENVRFLRLPAALRAPAQQRGSLTPDQVRAAGEPVEVVDAGEGGGAATYRSNASLLSLQLDAPEMLLAIDVRVLGRWMWQDATDEARTPASGHMTRSQTAAAASNRPLGLRGLMNLGNTCFMNSALQCMSNTQELQQYFLHNVHLEELNTDNPLGMGGAIANAFGRLLHQLWSRNNSGALLPREFKTALARFAPQFMGYAQQDSQELLAFLLDGLHEDLNRIIKKPYIEAPDWNGGGPDEMVRFAAKQWDIYKARNDSIIVDLFQGQYRSTLVCPVCGKVSIKFDPFMYLTLPIPNTRKWRGRVFFVPWDRSRPIAQVELQLPATASVGQLRERAAALVEAPAAHLAVGEVWSHRMYRWLADYEQVRDIAAGDYVYLWELPEPFTLPRALKTRSGAPTSRFGFFSRISRSVEDVENTYEPPDARAAAALPVYSSTASSGSRFGFRGSAFADGFGLPFFVSIAPAQAADVEAVYDAVLAQYVRFSKYPGDSVAQFKERATALLREQQQPSGEGEGAEATTLPETLAAGTPAPPAQPETTRPFSLFFAVPGGSEPMSRGDDATEQSTEPLEARIARLGPKTGDSAQWPALFTGGALMCVWHAAVAEALFHETRPNHTWGSVSIVQDAEMKKQAANPDGKKRTPKLTLDDCLDEFTKEEELGENDLWYCPSCKEFRQATKKFDLWKVPDILVVHLKRFSAGRMTRDKLDNFIDFPIEGLNLEDRVESTKTLREIAGTDRIPENATSADSHDDQVARDQPIYDLYAVDNHFGGLGGGHYTAFAKNPDDGQWYNYDDSSVRPVSNPESVKSSAAYLLFYRRRSSRTFGGKSREKIEAMAAKGDEGSNKPAGDDNDLEDTSMSSPVPSFSRRAETEGSYLGDVPLPPSDSDSD